MKLTKENLRKIISEELEETTLNKPHPTKIVKEISKLANEAVMDKSFGFRPETTIKFYDELSELLDQLKPSFEDRVNPLNRDPRKSPLEKIRDKIGDKIQDTFTEEEE